MSEWKTIDSAPKDGTEILACDDQGAFICWWLSTYSFGDVWMSDKCVDFGGHENPTHWMEIPFKPLVKDND